MAKRLQHVRQIDVLENLGYARAIAIDYHQYVDREDVEQAAALGLVEAAARYEPGKGATLETYANGWIHGACVRAIKNAPQWAQEPRERAAPAPGIPHESGALHAAARGLRGRMRHVVERRLARETHAAIGRGLGIGEAAVRKIERRAIVQPRELLERQPPLARPTFGVCWSAVRQPEARCSACFDRDEDVSAHRREVIDALGSWAPEGAADASRPPGVLPGW